MFDIEKYQRDTEALTKEFKRIWALINQDKYNPKWQGLVHLDNYKIRNETRVCYVCLECEELYDYTESINVQLFTMTDEEILAVVAEKKERERIAREKRMTDLKEEENETSKKNVYRKG